MFSGDMDKALAGFIIATGAAASGWDVTIFFTFWGINAMRDPSKKAPKPKDMMSKMFDMMLPKGPDALKLGKMNMLGIGTSMMKSRMAAKNIKSLKGMIDDARELGVKFLICDLSMGIMGVQKEEFMEGVDFCGVGRYLQEAKDSQLNLFI
jgi:peroxiredoxin family protein